ncbi:MAG TPA: dihydroorotate dehydrogenase-like protein [Bacteroidales bacterium]|nr:dihydroorotate dehydrogenase-like protein [Bacteroidales bacterium]
MDLSTKYMGLTLKNPVIAASSGLTSSVEGVVELEKAGAAAVVLKSLFEEQIMHNYKSKLEGFNMESVYPEAEDYINHHSRMQDVEEYLKLIRDCKKAVKIPVIASINCISAAEWVNFSLDIEAAGADALELNLSIQPSDTQRHCGQIEELYIEILNDIIKKVKIPVSIKISPYFSGLTKSALRFSFTGIKGMVLFNRYYTPDIDIETFEIVNGPVFSSPDDLNLPLRWIAMLSERVVCDIAASTGVHDGEAMVKVLLAGAKAAQVCSVLYQDGLDEIRTMLDFLEDYMKRHSFETVAEFTGRMSMRKTENPAAFERVQFMKYFAEIE